MKTLLLFIFLVFGIGGFQKIAEMNQHIRQGEMAFRKKQFAAAVMHYEKLVYEHNQKKPAMLLNLAHAYRKNNQAEKAQKIYEQCLKNENPFIRSVAWEQLGTLQTLLPDYQKALTFYKRAIVANPENEQARYNYELLKKYLRQNPDKQNQLPEPDKKEKQNEQKPQPEKQDQQQSQSEKPDQNRNQEKESQDKQEPSSQEQKPEKQTDPKSQQPPKQENPNGQNGNQQEQKQGEEKGQEDGQDLAKEDEKQPSANSNKKPGKEQASGDEKRLQTQYERLRKANISPEKANMMLDAMRAAEQQYLQQLPKKPSKNVDKSKPNW